jgi:hypothetical protein
LSPTQMVGGALVLASVGLAAAESRA